MQLIPKWYYNEASHSGIDYSNQDVVDEYDNQHTKSEIIRMKQLK